ncbi:DUF192 domain-containing protein [Opitutus sp. ER46]|uniref:DUF192 domain-containing protein n=1 Tax=Opitutus sp. ER46 TaxID=2161864 RepID=UPI000D2FEB05|nr:DUF192 domain-containing protein [Opitutus sp. ER46]PTX96689.1 DUF192 domain-containing protein [Opitutus sp. ER46]
MHPWLRVVLALSAVVVAAGLPACAQKKSGVESRKTVADFFSIKVGEKVVRLQLAVLDVEQERGLMFRRDLGPDDGMLFVYPRTQRMSFWMRNTPTPLDIGYFDAQGVLREIYPLQPFDEAAVASRSTEIKFPLEMPQGWFAAKGVRPGAQLDLKAVAAALKERGFEPRQFGLGEFL